jgi:hypothetical protein
MLWLICFSFDYDLLQNFLFVCKSFLLVSFMNENKIFSFQKKKKSLFFYVYFLNKLFYYYYFFYMFTLYPRSNLCLQSTPWSFSNFLIEKCHVPHM